MMPIAIAMWSGPRNISTAMMRAWENREDTVVHDEPLYAHYLNVTGIEHPGAEEIIATYDSDWQSVTRHLTGPVEASIYYQKHMTHHMLPGMERKWILGLKNCFLIRAPERVVASFTKIIPDVEIDQTGFPQQIDLFRYVVEHTGEIPPVLDARDVLTDPRSMLSQLCTRLGVPFSEAMLNWPAGKRDSDGIWAKYWYSQVEQSTGFMPYKPGSRDVPEHLRPMVDECNIYYEEMAQYAIRP